MRRRRAYYAMVVLSSVLFLSPPVFSDVSHLIRYQGTAVDTQGVPLEGPYTLTFRLYDAGTGGHVIWEETQLNVPMAQGHFSVLLGQGVPLNTMDWSHPCWLSVLVNGEELLPRQPITSVPLAITAERLAVPVTTSTIADDDHSLVPSSAIIMWDGESCPVGYTRLSALDGALLKASSTATAPTIMSAADLAPHAHAVSNHVHTTPDHVHTLNVRLPGQTTLWNTTDPPSYSTSHMQPSGGGITGPGGEGETSSVGSGRVATLLLCKKD